MSPVTKQPAKNKLRFGSLNMRRFAEADGAAFI